MGDEQTITIKDSPQTVAFTDALYRSKCGGDIEWEASFDADGTTYTAECCGYSYDMSEPLTVKVEREKL